MENLSQNNVLIAEFMGWKKYVDDVSIQLYKLGEEIKHVNDLRYHSSWDWLMSVVEKIESLYYVDEFSIQWESVKGRHYVSILPTRNNALLPIYINDVNKITAIYKTVIEFIKWYKENEKNKTHSSRI